MEDSLDSSAAVCRLCGEIFKLPEDGVSDNLPRVLLCGHIFCTFCLLSTESDIVVCCPECQVESTLPEGGVYGLQPPNSLKMLKEMDDALVLAAETLSQLEDIEETLKTSFTEQVKRERARLEIEIEKGAEKAMDAVQKWKDTQLVQLTKLEAKYTTTQAAVCQVQEKKKALELAMQMGRGVKDTPSLQKYCALDKVLETLQTPLTSQFFDMKCLSMGSGIRVVFHSDDQNENLSLSLKMEVSSPEPFPESRPLNSSPDTSNRNSSRKPAGNHISDCVTPIENKLNTSQKQDLQSPGVHNLSPEPQPHQKSSPACHSSMLNSDDPDVIIEEIREEQALPPTGPELANDKWRAMTKRRNILRPNTNRVAQWVVVTHIVDPSHFYIQYVAEKKQNKILLKKINHFCSRDNCNFTSEDTVETGSLVFAKYKDDLWCRARVVEILKTDGVHPVKKCFVTQLAAIRIFFHDYGLTKSISIVSPQENAESSLKAVNTHVRKVGEAASVELGNFPPQAVRCSLKDLVPYDLEGWSKKAEVEFNRVVSCSVVGMCPLGQDRESLLVDLTKTPMDQFCDFTDSVSQYLVFIEVARFYSPVKLDEKTLFYYPPVYPEINTELSALVSHINSPADFYIQLIDDMDSLLLYEKLQDFYSITALLNDEQLSIYCPEIGQTCVALFDDKMWCRAQVTGHLGRSKVEVCYVDFGCKRALSVGDLRKIKDEFLVLPSMAIPCCLSNVLPKDGDTFSDACKERFLSLAHRKIVTVVATAKVSKAEPLPVKLFEGNPKQPLTSISDMLVKEELVCYKEGIKTNNTTSPFDDSGIWNPPLEFNSSIEATEAPNQKTSEKQHEDPSDFHPHLKLPTQLTHLNVRVTHVNSPSSFYIQLIENDPQLTRICEQLETECALMEPVDVEWEAEMYCSALIARVWHRGQICSDVTSNNTAEVKLCDYGNVVKVNISDLRPLPPSLIGSLALECTLNDIRPTGGSTTWTNTARDMFSNHLTKASTVLTIKELTDERPVSVTLLCYKNNKPFENVSDFLTSKGLALKERKLRSAPICQPGNTNEFSPMTKTERDEEKIMSPASALLSPLPSAACNSSPPIPPKPAPRTAVTAEKVQTLLYKPPELPHLGPTRISVSAVGDDGLIYARTQNEERQLEELREKIQQSMKTLPRQKPYTWKSVKGCVVIGSDMLWYRGQLLEVLGGSVKVQYVDYGLVENIPVVHVHPMMLCDDVPQLCLPCQLLGVKPVGLKWHQDAVTLLREILVKRSVDMHIVELPSDPRGPLTVQIHLDGLNLSSILCHYQHAFLDQTVLPLKGLSAPPVLEDWDINTEGLMKPEDPILGPFATPTLPEKGQHFKVRVNHLCTPNELFLTPLEGSQDLTVAGETLDEALTRINEDLHLLPHVTNLHCGEPVLVEYSDGRYYRAKLMKILSIEPVTVMVQHVDFGSDGTLTLNKLRQMPAELLQFPPQALKVKIAGLKAPRISREINLLPYSPKWSMKAVMVMIDLLHTNITATVVAREPELSVLLFNEDKELVHMPLVRQGLAELE